LLLGLAARLSFAVQVPDPLPPAALEEDCVNVVAGDRCHRAVTYALERGVAEHPEWYPAFQRSSSSERRSAERDFRKMQEVLHDLNKAGCGRPCPPGYVPPVRTETKPEVQPEVQEVQAEAQEAESTAPGPMTENRSMTDMSLDSLSRYLNDPRWRREYEKEHPEPRWREEYEATVAATAALEREEQEMRHAVRGEVANATDEAAGAAAPEGAEAAAPLPEVAGEERAGGAAGAAAPEGAEAPAPLPEVAGEERGDGAAGAAALEGAEAAAASLPEAAGE